MGRLGIISLKRPIKLLCAWLLVVVTLWAAVTFVQAPTPVANSGSSTTMSLAFGGAVTVGNTIVVGAACGLNGSATAADSVGNTYTIRGTKQHPTDVFTEWVFTAPVTTGGTPTVTVTFQSACTFRNLAIGEYSGTPVPVVIDGSIAQGSGTGSSFTTGNIVTTVAADLLICFAASGASTGTFTGVTGWTDRAHVGGADAIYMFDQFPSAAGTYACAGTVGSASNFEWIAQAFAIKGVSASRVQHRAISQ